MATIQAQAHTDIITAHEFPAQVTESLSLIIPTNGNSQARTALKNYRDLRAALRQDDSSFDRANVGASKTTATSYQATSPTRLTPRLYRAQIERTSSITDQALEDFFDYVQDHLAKGNGRILGIENIAELKRKNPGKPILFSYVTHSMQTLEIAIFSLLVSQTTGKKPAVAVASPMLVILGPLVCKQLNIISLDDIEKHIKNGEDVIVLSDGFQGANTSNICEQTVGIKNGDGNVRADVLTSRTGLARIAVKCNAAMSVVYSTGADHVLAVHNRFYSDWLAGKGLPAFAIDLRSLYDGPEGKQYAPLTFFCDEAKLPPNAEDENYQNTHGLSALHMHRIKEVLPDTLKEQLDKKTLDQWTLGEVDQAIDAANEHLAKLKQKKDSAAEEDQELKPLEKNGLNLLRTIREIADQTRYQDRKNTTISLAHLFPVPDGYKSFSKDIQNLIGNEFSQYSVYSAEVLGTADDRTQCSFAKTPKATKRLLQDTIRFHQFINDTLEEQPKTVFTEDETAQKVSLKAILHQLQPELDALDEKLNTDRKSLISILQNLNVQTKNIIARELDFYQKAANHPASIWLMELATLLTGRHEKFDIDQHLQLAPKGITESPQWLALKANLDTYTHNLNQREELVAAIDNQAHQLELLFGDHYETAYDNMPITIRPEDRRFVSLVDTTRGSDRSIKTPILHFALTSLLAPVTSILTKPAALNHDLTPLKPSSFSRLPHQAEQARKSLNLLDQWAAFEQDIRGGWRPTFGGTVAGTFATSVAAFTSYAMGWPVVLTAILTTAAATDGAIVGHAEFSCRTPHLDKVKADQKNQTPIDTDIFYDPLPDEQNI